MLSPASRCLQQELQLEPRPWLELGRWPWLEPLLQPAKGQLLQLQWGQMQCLVLDLQPPKVLLEQQLVKLHLEHPSLRQQLAALLQELMLRLGFQTSPPLMLLGCWPVPELLPCLSPYPPRRLSPLWEAPKLMGHQSVG